MSSKIERKRAELADEEAAAAFIATKRANWEARDAAIAAYLESVEVSDLVEQFSEIREAVDAIKWEFRQMLQPDRDALRESRRTFREEWRQPAKEGAAPETIVAAAKVKETN